MSTTTAQRRNLAAYLAGLSRPLPVAVRRTSTGDRPADLPHVLARIAACGHPPEAASALAAMWTTLPEATRTWIAAPLRPGAGGYLHVGAARAVQTSGRTCGSAVLVMVLAAGDPVVAAWLATGRRLATLPAEISGVAGTAAQDSDAPDAPSARFEAAQQAMLQATSRGALGVVSWPTSLGTPPWTAARHARFPGVRYTHRPVDDSDRPAMERLLSWLRAGLDRGVPVPLYTGGDLVRGVSSAVPRHVVLAVPPRPGSSAQTVAVYDPAHGRVHELDGDELVARTGPHPALGGWSHVCWAVLPRAAGPSAARPSGRGLR